eukprot:gene10503-12225_t
MFFNYTAVLNMNVQQSVFYFSNRIVGKQALHRQELVSDKDVYAYPLTFFREDGMVKPFGKIVLKIAPGLLDVYLIRFEAMATYWRYILVSDYLKAIKNPVVLDQQTQVIFKGPNPIELPSGLTVTGEFRRQSRKKKGNCPRITKSKSRLHILASCGAGA